MTAEFMPLLIWILIPGIPAILFLCGFAIMTIAFLVSEFVAFVKSAIF